jgi:hypothetical protein
MASNQAKRLTTAILAQRSENAIAARTAAVNSVNVEDREGHHNQGANMEIIDGKLTVANSIAQQSNYHMGFSALRACS